VAKEGRLRVPGMIFKYCVFVITSFTQWSCCSCM